MSLVDEARLHFRDVRSRLRNPPNAVPDHGINLRNVIPLQLPEAKSVTIKSPALSDHEAFGPIVSPAPLTPDDIAFGPVVIDAHAAVSFDEILKSVSRFYRISYLELKSPRRNKLYVRARHVACWLARHHTALSFPSIGRRFGGRDHTTVLHAVTAIDKQLKHDSNLAVEIAVIRSSFGVACASQLDGAQHASPIAV